MAQSYVDETKALTTPAFNLIYLYNVKKHGPHATFVNLNQLNRVVHNTNERRSIRGFKQPIGMRLFTDLGSA